MRLRQIFFENEFDAVGERLQQAERPDARGPQRFWMCADTLRSSQTLYATAVSRMPTTASDLMIEMMINVVMLNVFLVWRGHSCPRAVDLDCCLVRRNFRRLQICFREPNSKSWNTVQACPN